MGEVLNDLVLHRLRATWNNLQEPHGEVQLRKGAVMMLSKIAKIWGILFIIVGILGFIPGVSPNGHLLGVFHINGAHNMVHLLTGIVALFCGYASNHASKLYFLVFGVVYALVALIGFMAGPNPVFGFIANNLADAWLHVVIAVASLAIGLSPETARISTRPTVP